MNLIIFLYKLSKYTDARGHAQHTRERTAHPDVRAQHTLECIHTQHTQVHTLEGQAEAGIDLLGLVQWESIN